MGYFNTWSADRRRAPQISFTLASTANIIALTSTVCARLTTSNGLADYAGSERAAGLGSLTAAQLAAVGTKLNTRTR